jgi:hypothetical protein
MEPLPDLAVLQAVLEALASRELAMYLSPPGQKRGVVVTHGLYPPEEAERVRQAFANQATADTDEGERPLRAATARQELAAAMAGPGWVAEVAALKADVGALRAALDSLAAEVRALKSELGV